MYFLPPYCIRVLCNNPQLSGTLPSQYGNLNQLRLLYLFQIWNIGFEFMKLEFSITWRVIFFADYFRFNFVGILLVSRFWAALFHLVIFIGFFIELSNLLIVYFLFFTLELGFLTLLKNMYVASFSTFNYFSIFFFLIWICIKFWIEIFNVTFLEPCHLN